MRFVFGALVAVVTVTAASFVHAADVYDYDLVHSSVSFKARFLDISWIHGRFNDVSGKFVLDREDPSKSSFQLTINVDSVDTANEKRDEHLRQPDYFDHFLNELRGTPSDLTAETVLNASRKALLIQHAANEGLRDVDLCSQIGKNATVIRDRL